MGKKIGIAAMICAIIFVIFSIVAMTQAPEFPDDLYELAVKDKEAYTERMQEIEDGASVLYKTADIIMTISGLGGIVLAIISIVKLIKGKEKGKIIPILSIVVIVVFFFISVFSVGDMGAAFEAGFNAGMEMQE